MVTGQMRGASGCSYVCGASGNNKNDKTSPTHLPAVTSTTSKAVYPAHLGTIVLVR